MEDHEQDLHPWTGEGALSRQVRYLEIPPPPPLDPWIHCVWMLEGGDGNGAVQPVVPDGRPEIIVHLGEPFGLVDARGDRQRQAEVVVAGQMTRPIGLVPSADPRVAGIRLTPAGAGRLFPMAELTDTIVALRDLAPALADGLLDTVAKRGTARERLERAALAVARFARGRPSALLAESVRGIERETRLKQIAYDGGVTARTLQRRFRAEVGVGPKLYQRIIRFRRTVQLLPLARRRGFARVAAIAGYFDQAHMIRDFQRFAGTTPSRFLRSTPELAVTFIGNEGGE